MRQNTCQQAKGNRHQKNHSADVYILVFPEHLHQIGGNPGGDALRGSFPIPERLRYFRIEPNLLMGLAPGFRLHINFNLYGAAFLLIIQVHPTGGTKLHIIWERSAAADTGFHSYFLFP